jgi:hypothetical protein
LREDAQLHVVLVSARGETSERGVDEYIDALSSRLTATEDLVISALVGEGGSCDAGGSVMVASERTGGYVGNLCEDDWADHWAALADISKATPEQSYGYTLSYAPVIETMYASVGGTELEYWTFDPDSNVLTVVGADDDFSLGARIDLEYVAAVACPEE